MLHFLIDGSNRSILPLTRLPSLNQVPFCPVMVEQVESKYSLSATVAGSFDLEVKVKAARVDPVPDSEMPLDTEHRICGGTFKFGLP